MPRQQTARDDARFAVPQPLARRLLWFVTLWLAGVGSLGVVAFGLKLWLTPK
jgi:hypothetical protein